MTAAYKNAGRSFKPDFQFMRPSLARWIAFGFGSGLAPRAPGTFGTLFAWISWLLLTQFLGVELVLWLCLPGFLIGVWACEKTGYAMGIPDHGAIVWDEVIAFWLLLSIFPGGFWLQLSCFVLFRFFDIVKPPPIRFFDTRLKNGFGVMFDDLLAAGYAMLLLVIWRALV